MFRWHTCAPHPFIWRMSSFLRWSSDYRELSELYNNTCLVQYILPIWYRTKTTLTTVAPGSRIHKFCVYSKHQLTPWHTMLLLSKSSTCLEKRDFPHVRNVLDQSTVTSAGKPIIGLPFSQHKKTGYPNTFPVSFACHKFCSQGNLHAHNMVHLVSRPA